MRQKSNNIKTAWIGAVAVIIAAIIAGLFGLFGNKTQDQKSINTNISANDSSKVSVTNNQNDIKGDFVNGNKIIVNNKAEKDKNDSKINAPNALIVTQNQTGDNTVNVNQITSESYQKISEELKNILNQNIDFLVSRYINHPKIIIEIESGNSMRDKIARDLESFLVPKNLGNYPKGNTFMGRFPDYPVSLFSSKKNFQFTIDFLKSIKPYIESEFYIDTAFTSNDFVKIYINGTPSFNNNGKVKIE